MRRVPCNKALAAVVALLAGLPVADSRAECTCIWEGSFADVARRTDLVVEARIGSVKGNAADIAVESTLQGEAFDDTLRVWLKARDYCRPEAELFPPGSRWVLALERIDSVPEGGFDPGTPNISYGRVGDYFLSSCGGYWLSSEGGRVTGNLIDAPRWARQEVHEQVDVDQIAL